MQTLHKISHKKKDPIELAKQMKDKAKDSPYFIDSAYLKTQPKRELDYSHKESKEEKMRNFFKKCRHCGLKFCVCYDYTKGN